MTSTPPTDPNRTCWFVGSAYGGTDDQAARFFRERIWENGYDDRFLDEVKAMRPGDRIAIKAVFAQKRNLPFPNPDEYTVGGMYIKAIGVVANNPGNGLYIGVDWTPVTPPRPWYFAQFRQTVHQITPATSWETDALIDFAFNHKPQNYNQFRNAPRWRERFGD